MIQDNLLRLLFLLIVAIITVIVILFDSDASAQAAVTHMMALCVGALLHNIGGKNN